MAYHNNSQGRDSAHVVSIDSNDQNRLKQFFAHELAYYNNIVEAFEARTRSSASAVSVISDKEIALLCELARHGLQLNDVVNSEKLPPSVSVLKSTAVSHDGRLILSSMMQHIFGVILKPKLAVIPATKAAMLRGMIEFYREQARIFKEPINSDVNESSYKVPPSNLSKHDLHTKRHVQVPRSVLQISYNSQLDESEVTTPLTKKPIVIQGVNLSHQQRWTTMILRQESGAHVDYHTPWTAEFRNTGNKYLIKLVDLVRNRQNYTMSKAFG
jgi:hypothetical protein